MTALRTRAAVFTALCFALPAIAQESRGANCTLSEAPLNSGELFFSSGKVELAGRVYPRLSEISADYTGCQVLWLSLNSGSVTRSVTFFQAGRVVSVNPAPDGIPLCEPGEKAANSGCTSRKEVVLVSFPNGCAARTAESRVIPKDCLDAFQAEFRIHDQIAD